MIAAAAAPPESDARVNLVRARVAARGTRPEQPREVGRPSGGEEGVTLDVLCDDTTDTC